MINLIWKILKYLLNLVIFEFELLKGLIFFEKVKICIFLLKSWCDRILFK